MKLTVETGDPKSLTLLDENARFMTHEQFATLVKNVKHDGQLTSLPLVYRHEGRAPFDERKAGTLEVLSGNHRVKAAVAADLKEIRWLEIEGPLSKQERLAHQLSHNAIAGQDDPATLRKLYDQLQDIDAREYSGLDDKTLEMLAKVNVGALSEANLDFATIQVVFLPAELDAARQSLKDATTAVQADGRWLAPWGMYEAMLDTLASAHSAYGVGNVATALGILLAIVDEHLDDLRAGWYDPAEHLPLRTGTAPIETVVGAREMPTEAAAIVAQALDKMMGDLEITDNRWRALEMVCAEYLAGA